MKLSTQYQGEHDPFEGDRTLWLRSLPAGARVTRATVTLDLPKDSSLNETFIFGVSNGSSGLLAKDWGITPNSGSSEGVRFVEIDFHTRRTLVAVQGSQSGIGNVPGTETPGASLQVDMGGTLIGIANDGTFMAPDKRPWVVAFSPNNFVALPGLTVNKFRLSGILQNPNAPNQSRLDISQITIRSVPTNVSLRLHQMPPFWTYLGELTIAKTSPDFAFVLNTFLETAVVENGFYIVPLVIHSDTIARLNVSLLIEFVIEQPVLPPYLPEATLVYGFGTIPKIDLSLVTAKLPRGAIPIAGATRAAILGEFQPTRIAYGGVGTTPPTVPVQITPNCSLAQPFRADREIAVTGIDLSLANTQPGLTGLNISIQADVDGKPLGEVLTRADVLVEKPLPEQSSWGSATLPTPFRVLQNTTYWLVVQSQTGDAFWDTIPDATIPDATKQTMLHATFDQGLSWRPATIPESPTVTAAALFRLRNVPDRFTIPVQLQIGEDPKVVRQLDEFAPLGRVEFEFDFAEKLGEYLADPTIASPCGSGNLIANGDFTLPPPNDATQRLFGFDAARAELSDGGYGYPDNNDVSFGQTRPTLEGKIDLSRGVDLSVERFIVLAVDDTPPVRIDCAGKDPSRTELDEIIAAINTALGTATGTEASIAFKVLENRQQTSRLGVRSMSPNSTHPLTSVELYLWCSTELPSKWQGTTGYVHRLKLPDESNRTAVLLANLNLLNEEKIQLFCAASTSSARRTAPPTEISLTQRIPCSANCTYRFQFTFGLVNHSLSSPRWQVVWLNQQGTILRTDEDTIPIPTQFHQNQFRQQQIPPWLFEARVTAPVEATQAEIRFVQPSPGGLWLTETAFSPTLEALDDIGLALGEHGSSHWQRSSAWIDPTEAGIVLRGNGSEDVILTQVADVMAGEAYKLQVQARPEVPLLTDLEIEPIQTRARLELRWLDGVPGVPLILPLDGRGFPLQTWTITAPLGTTQAEIRLIQPQGRGNLIVESVSLSRLDRVSVPLVFLSETPGELTVSNWYVTYDLPEPSPTLSHGSNSSTPPPRSALISQPPITSRSARGAMSARNAIVPPPAFTTDPSPAMPSPRIERQVDSPLPSATPMQQTLDLVPSPSSFRQRPDAPTSMPIETMQLNPDRFQEIQHDSEIEFPNELLFTPRPRKTQSGFQKRPLKRIVKRVGRIFWQITKTLCSTAKFWGRTLKIAHRVAQTKRTEKRS
jgi:hypothetical protein